MSRVFIYGTLESWSLQLLIFLGIHIGKSIQVSLSGSFFSFVYGPISYCFLSCLSLFLVKVMVLWQQYLKFCFPPPLHLLCCIMSSLWLYIYCQFDYLSYNVCAIVDRTWTVKCNPKYEGLILVHSPYTLVSLLLFLREGFFKLFILLVQRLN